MEVTLNEWIALSSFQWNSLIYFISHPLTCMKYTRNIQRALSLLSLLSRLLLHLLSQCNFFRIYENSSPSGKKLWKLPESYLLFRERSIRMNFIFISLLSGINPSTFTSKFFSFISFFCLCHKCFISSLLHNALFAVHFDLQLFITGEKLHHLTSEMFSLSRDNLWELPDKIFTFPRL